MLISAVKLDLTLKKTIDPGPNKTNTEFNPHPGQMFFDIEVAFMISIANQSNAFATLQRSCPQKV